MSADMLTGRTCWIVGQTLGGGAGDCGVAWLFQGVFSSEERAVAACVRPHYFVGPATIDEVLPEAVTEWPGHYYPWEGRTGE